MSDLVSRLLATKPEWEKSLATKTQNLGDRSEWTESDATLIAVVSAAQDPVLGGMMTNKVESKSNEERDVQSTKLSELRDLLELSLDELCKRNMDIFQSKLAFHTQQLQEAIASSAQFVVRTLTLEAKEWDRLLYYQLTIKKVVLARITSLYENFAKNRDAAESTHSVRIKFTTDNLISESDPRTYLGGIWSLVDLKRYRAYREDCPISYASNDVADYRHDLSLLDDFPLPSVEGEPTKHLKYVPWEEHIKSMNQTDVPLAIPDEWYPAAAEEGGSTYRR
ncbi:hypothetical protein M413DRAFT_270783 [Hebeloma cylindrosporum]|uniref:Uncharacterized protein n=1 Tax=Hebeloma cylindrosporum TaxID=76867 RepID=A0A0C3CEI4_HEBCY|nr:hypothetical protein M413DRAFT_270783 [Hebeloma cylindrosporum h7]